MSDAESRRPGGGRAEAGGTADAITAAQRHGPRQIVAASIGNAVEWYDWYAYTFLATIFATQIFPDNDNPLVPLLNTFAVFAVGFFMRPIGGLLLGAFADRRGRRAALTLTISLMGAGSLVVAILPTYAQVGVLAPVLLVVARLVQGLSIGGEFAASTTFLVESARPRRRGLFSSFQYVSTTVGQLVASALSAVLVSGLTGGQMSAWGWRVPFVLGAVLALVGLWIRRGAHETHDVVDDIENGRVARPRLFEALLRHPRASFLIVGITIAGTICYYSWTTYLPTYAETYRGVDKAQALTASTIALAFFALIQPLGGLLSDRIGRRPMLLVFSGGFAIGVVPLLQLLGPGMATLLAVQGLGMVLLTGYTSIAAAINAEVFPSRVRASGIGFPYSLTVAIFGGTAPYVGTLFKAIGHPGWFPWYVAVLSLISFVVYLRLRETAGQPLS